MSIRQWHRSVNHAAAGPVSLVSARPAGSPALFIEASAYLGALALLLALALATAPIAGLWGRPAALALAIQAAGSLIVLRALPHHPAPRFGIANAITAARATLVAFIAGLALIAAGVEAPARGLAAALGWIALLGDGVDGWVARRTKLASAFGARFDMEVDAFFILVITFMLLRAGQTGAWVLAIGLARYIFVAAGWLWPVLARPLPASMRRKTVCVVTVVALLVALMPRVGPATAAAACAAGLAALAYSFAMDCLWLLRFARVPAAAPRPCPAPRTA
ncbi:MAG: CDP-alcohol phosphatidyltransferase family protein [Alphaproteobacteria bacterium]|nr:CDP-alcohol phosphatidyltransferase family protein [Alphaproteobacteria bacterium]